MDQGCRNEEVTGMVDRLFFAGNNFMCFWARNGLFFQWIFHAHRANLLSDGNNDYRYIPICSDCDFDFSLVQKEGICFGQQGNLFDGTINHCSKCFSLGIFCDGHVVGIRKAVAEQRSVWKLSFLFLQHPCERVWVRRLLLYKEPSPCYNKELRAITAIVQYERMPKASA